MKSTSQKPLLVLVLSVSLPLFGMGGHNAPVFYFLLLIALAGFIIGLLGGIVSGLKRVNNLIGLGATFILFLVAGIVFFCVIIPGPITFSGILPIFFFFLFPTGLALVIGYFLMISLIRWLASLFTNRH